MSKPWVLLVVSVSFLVAVLCVSHAAGAQALPAGDTALAPLRVEPAYLAGAARLRAGAGLFALHAAGAGLAGLLAWPGRPGRDENLVGVVGVAALSALALVAGIAEICYGARDLDRATHRHRARWVTWDGVALRF